ncbi:ROK family protein [Ruminococcaceae bacterium OttesenSCG-928-I18]|nr:ROK family protein [Ruminococcaceae bacterium OttesenSCG-928-I18]
MYKQQGGNKEVYKRLNRGLLLKLLATGQCTSRVELSRVMGLSKMAISNMVAELMALDLVSEGAVEQNEELGRNPIQLRISPNAPKVAGLFIFRGRCEVVLCDLTLQVMERRDFRFTNITKEELLEKIFEMTDEVLQGAGKVAGIGVASIGPLDISKGVILNPMYFHGIENIPIVHLLEERYHLPAFLESDNQCGVLAEKLYGNGRDFTDIIMIGVGLGVGCGIIVDDELYRNQQKLVPEFGHISIDYRGNTCICGCRGCVETYIGTPILLERLRSATGSEDTFEQFCKRSSEPFVYHILADAIDKLSIAVVNMVNLLNPKLILLGHDAAYYPDELIALLEKKVNDRRFAPHAAPIQIKRPHFMLDAQLMGTVCLINRQVFKGNLPYG